MRAKLVHAQAVQIDWQGGCHMATFAGRDMHLIRKALAIAILAIERQDGPFQSWSDRTDMKALLEEITTSDVQLAHYCRAARIAVTGSPDG
jgi:hypothetical protein